MIYVKKVAIGNNKEAFVEDRFSNGINIIYSDENNKGKTMIMQSIYYAIGNYPKFPIRFNPKDYIFYLELEIDSQLCYFLRNKDSIAVITNEFDVVFDDVNTFEKFFNDHIYPLPKIIKDDKEIMVSLELFLQNVFLGSDERSTSNVQHAGRFNKKDYVEMLYYMGTNELIKTLDDEGLKSDLKSIKFQIKEINKKIKLNRDLEKINEIYNPALSKEQFDKFKGDLELLTNKLSELNKSKIRLVNKKAKKNTILHEITSITRDFKVGSFRCIDCGSNRITYTTKRDALSFDISNDAIRNKIKNSLYYEIDGIEKELSELDFDETKIRKELDILNNKKEGNIAINDILYYLEYGRTISNYNDQLIPLIDEEKKLELSIKKLNSNKTVLTEKRKFIKNYILEAMSIEYNSLNKDKPYDFVDFFTKSTETYSGSENQVFLFSRILSIVDYFKLPFPIVIDAFREGEISSPRENEILKRFSKFNNQIILSCTLKGDEYNSEKYIENENINPLDYSEITEYHILNNKYLDKFKELIIKFGVSMF